MKKHNTFKKLKKATALLLSALTLVSTLPINSVYAYDVYVQNTGVSTDFGTVPKELKDTDFGHYKVGGMRCYIYDKKTGEFLSSESNDENIYGKEGIDFLGFDGFYEYAQSNVNSDDIDKGTIFGTLNSVYLSADWPFGDDHFFAKYDGSANMTYSGTQETNNWLKANGGEKLKNIIKEYWGDTVLSEYMTSETMLWSAEPLFIISEAYGGEVENPEDLGTSNYYKSGTVTRGYEELHIKVIPVESSMITYSNHQDNYNYNMWVGSDRTAYKGSPSYYYPDAEHVMVTSNKYSYKQLRDSATWSTTIAGTWLETAIEEDHDSPDISIDHYDVETWYEVEKKDVPLYRAFRHVYGTARNIYERDIAGAEFPDRWEIEDASCNAVYVGGVGENGEYNSEFEGTLVFPDSPDMGNSPTYNGQSNCLEIDGVPTTWGFFMLSSLELGSVQWHTNNPVKNYPSGADDCSGQGRINQSGSGGNKLLLKVYETRNKSTGALLDCKTFSTAQVPNIIEIDDESVDTQLSISCDEHSGDECRKSWITWYSKHRNEGYSLNEDSTVLYEKGSGFKTQDWAVLGGDTSKEAGDNIWNLMAELAGSPYSTQIAGLENYGLQKSGVGVGNKHYVSMNKTDNILVVRYVKYVNDDTNEDDTPYNYDVLLTESKLADVTKLDSSITDTKRASKMFVSNALAGDEFTDSHLDLGVGVNLFDRQEYIDRTLGYMPVIQGVERTTLKEFKTSTPDNGVRTVIRRNRSDETNADMLGITNVGITEIGTDGKASTVKGTDSITSGLQSKFGTASPTLDSSSLVTDEDITEGNKNTSQSLSSNTIHGVELVSESTDPWTSSNAGDVSIADISTTTPDKSSITEGVYTRTADSDTNISTIIENNSGINGSIQSSVVKGITPIVKMGYTTLENNEYHRGNTLIALNKTRQFSVNSYGAISYLNPVNIIISSNMWALDNMLTNGDKQWNKDKVLKGGSIYSLSTDGEQQINITTIQMVNDGSDYDNSPYVSYGSQHSEVDVTPAGTERAHNEFRDEVINNLKKTYITQWLSDNSSDTNTLANDDSGAYRVSGLTSTGDSQYNSENGYSNVNKFNNNTPLQSDDKYWFNSTTDRTADSGNFDITGQTDSKTFYKFICNTDGCVYMLKSNDIEFSNPTVTKILEQNEQIDKLSNQEAMQLNAATNVLDNMLNTIVRDTGNDINASWSSKNGHWYNEYASVSLVKINTQVKMGLTYPSQRSCVVDTSLQPNSSSKLDMGTLALKSNFSTNWNDMQKFGTFLNQEVYLDKAKIMFRSRNIYIPNMSVQDNM